MTFKFGGTLVLERSFAYPAQILKRIEEERVTGFPGVPTIFAMLLQMDLSTFDLSSLRYLTNTAAALPPSHISQLREKFSWATLYLDVRPDRDQADPLPAAGPARPATRLGRHRHPRHRGLARGRDGHRLGAGRDRRAGGARPACDARLLGGPGGDRQALPARDRSRASGCATPATSSAWTRTAISTSSAARTTSSRAAARRWRPRKSRTCCTCCRASWRRSSACRTRSWARPSRPSWSTRGQSLTEAQVLAHCRAHLEDFMVPKYVEFRDELPMTSSGKVLQAGADLDVRHRRNPQPG